MLAVSALDVALASAIAAGVTGVAAPLSAWLIAQRGTSSAQALAREERVYQARVHAYDEGMTLAYQMQAMAVQTALAMDSGKPLAGPPPGYDPAKNLEVAGRMEVRGTVEAARGFSNVSEAATAFLHLYRELGGPFDARPPDDIREQVYAKRDEVSDARRQLGNLIRTDLGHA